MMVKSSDIAEITNIAKNAAREAMEPLRFDFQRDIRFVRDDIDQLRAALELLAGDIQTMTNTQAQAKPRFTMIVNQHAALCDTSPSQMLPREIKDCAELAKVDREDAFTWMKDVFSWTNP